MFLGRLGILAVLACTGGSQLARADAKPADDASTDDKPKGAKPAYEKMSLEELLQVPVVVTASRQEEAVTDAPGTTVIITREEIRLRGYAFLKDVLRDVPGMETLEYHSSDYGTLVPVRGVIGNNKIIVLVNGMRVNPPGGEDMMLRSDISVRDADRVEIVYGPGSTLYGQDAISAVINIITRQSSRPNVPIDKADARDRVLHPTAIEQRLATIGVELGYPLQKEVWGSLNLRIGEARVYGSVHYLEKELTNLSSSYPEFWSTQEALGSGRGLPLDPKRYDTGLNIMFRAEYGNASIQVWHRQSARNSSEAEGIPATLGYVQQARFEDMSTVAQARYALPFGKYFSLESFLTFNRYEVQPSSRDVFPAFGTAPDQQPAWALNIFKYARGISGALEERLIFRLDNKLSIVAGFFAAHYDITPIGTVLNGADLNGSIPAQAGDVNYYTRQGDPTSLVELPRISSFAYQNFGGYLEANWRIFRMLRLVLGFRIDKNTAVSDIAFSPRAALIFNYKSFTAKYLFSRAFVAPPPIFKYNVLPSANGLNIPNLTLAPETGFSNEVNLSYSNRYATLGASFYYNFQYSLFEASGDPINIVQQAWRDRQGTQPITLTHAANHGASQALGTDIFGKFNVGKVSGWASYSYTNLTFTTETAVRPMVGLSAHNFRLGATVSIFSNLHVTAGLIVKSIPEQMTQPEVLAGLIGVPWELNAHILYSPIPSLDLYADFRNLTDHKYYLATTSATPYPIQGFQGTGGLRFSF